MAEKYPLLCYILTVGLLVALKVLRFILFLKGDFPCSILSDKAFFSSTRGLFVPGEIVTSPCDSKGTNLTPVELRTCVSAGICGSVGFGFAAAGCSLTSDASYRFRVVNSWPQTRSWMGTSSLHCKLAAAHELPGSALAVRHC